MPINAATPLSKYSSLLWSIIWRVISVSTYRGKLLWRNMTNSKHRSLFQYYNFHTWMSLDDCSWAMALEQNSQQVKLCSIFPLLLLYVESVFIHTNTSSLQTLGSPSLLLHAANQGGGTEELLRNKKQTERGRTGKWSSIPWPLDPREHQGLLVLSPGLQCPPLRCQAGVHMSVNICFPASGFLDGRRGTFSPTASQSSSAPGHSPFFLGSPLLHSDGQTAQSASTALWPAWSRKFPHARCALQSPWGGGASLCLHSTGLQALLAPAQTLGRTGTFWNHPRKHPATHLCLRKNGKQRPQVLPQEQFVLLNVLTTLLCLLGEE